MVKFDVNLSRPPPTMWYSFLEAILKVMSFFAQAQENDIST